MTKTSPPAASKKAVQFFSYTVQRKTAFCVRLLFDLQLSLELCMRNIVHTLKQGCRVKMPTPAASKNVVQFFSYNALRLNVNQTRV